MTERNKAIDQYSSYAPVRALTPEAVVAAIARVLEENSKGTGNEKVGLSAIYIYTQLCDDPKGYGFESENQLPLMPDFAAICTGRFPSRHEGSKVFIRPIKELWGAPR